MARACAFRRGELTSGVKIEIRAREASVREEVAEVKAALAQEKEDARLRPRIDGVKQSRAKRRTRLRPLNPGLKNRCASRRSFQRNPTD